MMRDRSAARAIHDEVRGVVVFIGVIWLVFALDTILAGALTRRFALVPRSSIGSVGILTMPFLHGDFRHILSNTLPLLVLLLLLAGSNAKSWEIVGTLIVTGGVLLWLFGNATNARGELTGHVGASGLVFGLVGYLIGSGVFERRFIPMGVAVIVGLLFGGMIVNGLIPQSRISWGGHFFGLFAGVGLAYVMARNAGTPR